ncbi:hypothetical protein BJ912DRAFT_640460 [Pholiota molesta]|nr:hypothetical protein BJ912DRAFT_640460 [Pholiota molesta]
MATTPAHYIRTIHTSFTAAHPRNSPSAWASAAASPRYTPTHTPTQKDKDTHLQQHQPLQNATQFNQYQHPAPQHPQYTPQAGVSINTHNQHTYTHHLYALHGGYPPYPAGAGQGQGLRKGAAGAGGGRRRSVSIRMPPTYGPHRGRPAPAYKFDPFADDEGAVPVPASVTSPLTGGTQANRAASQMAEEQPLQRNVKASAPYTIHIPAAQPTEIQQYTPPPASPRPAARTAALRSLMPINGPLPGTAPTTTTAAPPQRSAAAPPKQAQATPNLSKIVAGILLNRVHAVGKPMRRRVLPHQSGDGEKGYRKSCLSSVVSVEA